MLLFPDDLTRINYLMMQCNGHVEWSGASGRWGRGGECRRGVEKGGWGGTYHVHETVFSTLTGNIVCLPFPAVNTNALSQLLTVY